MNEDFMKEFAGLNCNLGLSYDHEKDAVSGTAEVILLLTEPQYKVDDRGLYSDRTNIDAVRFAVTYKRLNALIDGLEKVAEDLARFEDRVSFEPDPSKEVGE